MWIYIEFGIKTNPVMSERKPVKSLGKSSRLKWCRPKPELYNLSLSWGAWNSNVCILMRMRDRVFCNWILRSVKCSIFISEIMKYSSMTQTMSCRATKTSHLFSSVHLPYGEICSLLLLSWSLLLLVVLLFLSHSIFSCASCSQPVN